MNHIFSLENRHCCGNAHAIISAKRCAIGGNPFAVNISFDGIGFEIEISVAVSLWNHVEVTLHNHTSAVFHPGSSRFFNNHIAATFNDGFQTQLLAKFFHVLNNLFLFARRAWDFG